MSSRSTAWLCRSAVVLVDEVGRVGGICRRWKERCKGLLFVEMLLGLETVVELAEEAVQQVALCGGMPVSMLASASVVRVRSR